MFAAVCIGAGCGSSDDSGSEFSGGNGGSSAGTGTGGSGAVSIGDGGGTGGGGGSGGIDEDSACAADEQEAKLLPLAMFIMLDKSGSMDDGGKWTAAVSALTQFVQDANSAGIKVALGYFPDGHSCNGAGYDVPDVAMGLLPGNAGAIVNSLNANGPSGNTPTEGALNGLVRDGYEQTNPAEKCIGLLVTDGEPNGCDESQSTLTGIAAAGLAGTPSTLTFTMGMGGADFNLLDAIAAAGGTTQSFDATAGAAAFLAALQAIKGAALSCEMLVPVPTQGELDPNQVNVNFIKGDGSIQTLGRVNDAASCVPGAWYYDNNTAPTQIILCPQTCSMVQADPNGKIKVLLGCSSKPPS
jgi:hypothetical protein